MGHFLPRVLVKEYHSRNQRVKSLLAIAVAGNFADTQFHLLSVTFEIINAQTDRVAVEKTLHFIEAASANYYRLNFLK